MFLSYFNFSAANMRKLTSLASYTFSQSKIVDVLQFFREFHPWNWIFCHFPRQNLLNISFEATVNTLGLVLKPENPSSRSHRYSRRSEETINQFTSGRDFSSSTGIICGGRRIVNDPDGTSFIGLDYGCDVTWRNFVYHGYDTPCDLGILVT